MVSRAVVQLMLATEFEIDEHDEYIDVVLIPNSDYFEDSDLPPNDEDDDDGEEFDWLPVGEEVISIASECEAFGSSPDNPERLERNHVFEWIDGERMYVEKVEDENLLPETVKTKIRDASLTDLFELFFSQDLKAFILEATTSSGSNLSLNELNTFLGIIILSILNIRTNRRDYWSRDPLVRCHAIRSAMDFPKFESIMSDIKLSKPEDRNINDKAWHVRRILEIFRKNAQQFGFFSTALSINQCMIQFCNPNILKRYRKAKLSRMGVKLWAICNKEGYVFDCDIYCGKGSSSLLPQTLAHLDKCALGSRVVMQMLHKLLTSVQPEDISRYHIYFNKFFCSSDLLIHLRNNGLRATGTVEGNKVDGTVINIDKQAERGTFIVKHDKNSGINYISMMDSKIISVLSTAAGTTPLTEVKICSEAERTVNKLLVPTAFKLYKNHVGGVDQHDFYCNKSLPSIRSKKWTFMVLVRIIQSSITNAAVLKNLVSDKKNKVSTNDVALHVASTYLAQ